MSPETETQPDRKFEPPFAAIIGSVFGVVAWLVFIILYALEWSKNYDLFQNVIFTIASLLIAALAIGAMWLIWLHLSGVPREWWNKNNRARIQKQSKNNEILDIGQRAGEIVAATILLLILGFYLYHQVANTGFFTSDFGSWEMFAFYGSIIMSTVPPLARTAIGRRNPVRPIEAFCNFFFAFASLWLLIVFPFNFAHFSAAFPMEIRFLFAWVTNYIAKIAFILAILGSFASTIYNIIKYFTFTLEKRRELAAEQLICA